MNVSQVMDGKKKKRNKISMSKEDLDFSSHPLSVDERPISKAGPLEFDELLERELAKGMPQAQPQPLRRESSASKTAFLKRGERAFGSQRILRAVRNFFILLHCYSSLSLSRINHRQDCR